MGFKDSKFVKSLKEVAPKIKKSLFNNDNENPNKNSAPVTNTIEQDNLRLENMVKDSLEKEFGTKIKKSKSYDLLVDAVVYNLKKKQLKDTDELEK